MGTISQGNERRSEFSDAPEVEIVERWRVACDGGEAALGHPRVWLQIPEVTGWVECGYCDKRYIHASAVIPGEPVEPGDPHPGVP